MKTIFQYLLLTAACAALGACQDFSDDTAFTPETPELSFVETSITAEKATKDYELSIKSNLPWRIECDKDWVSFDPSYGQGDATITVTVAANRTLDERTATISAYVIKGENVTLPVTQAAASASDLATHYYVKTDGSADKDGLTWETATTLANAIPNVYDAESSVVLSLWQLKAVMGVNLDENIDVSGSLSDYADTMLYDIKASEELSLDNNSTMRQLSIQAEQLASTVKMQQFAYLPSLALSFSYSMNAMTNDFRFSEYKWSPYSYVGLSLQIPIFSGGKRYNDVRAARVQSAELTVQRENTERQLRISIRQYLNKMETAMKSYSSAQSALESATKAYDIAQRSYNVGRSTLTDLNDAQLALTQASLTLSQAVYNFVTAKASLEGTLGADFIDEEGNVQLNKTYNNE